MSSALMQNYGTRELKFERGEGSYLFTKDGERYLDFGMGIAVNSLGHCNPKLIDALSDQAKRLWHTSNLYNIEPGEQLANKLVASTFADRVFLCNSGTEAIECGFKAIRRYFYSKGQTQKNRIVSMSGAFHGRSLAAIASAANPAHTEGFLVGDSGFDQAEFGNFESLLSVVTEKTAGIIIEPIQGEGGIRVAELEYLKKIRELCDSHNILLMLDEVQCGIGRTGSLYAYQQLGIKPDILATAKGLGGGFPIGACLATEEVAAALVAGTHGSTFGGNPLATAVSNAVLDTLNDADFLKNVSELGGYLKAELAILIERYPRLLTEVRGLGLMLGLYCQTDAGRLITRLQAQKLLVVKAGGNSIRLLPALNVSKEEIDSAVETISKVLADIENNQN
ncbi:MAG: aspartate aminotransferase family protein [Gammaproteobacteria bacterium]|nr:aspartate aminotransferase family protein [Gammaproteobacteria bacterium]